MMIARKNKGGAIDGYLLEIKKKGRLALGMTESHDAICLGGNVAVKKWNVTVKESLAYVTLQKGVSGKDISLSLSLSKLQCKLDRDHGNVVCPALSLLAKKSEGCRAASRDRMLLLSLVTHIPQSTEGERVAGRRPPPSFGVPKSVNGGWVNMSPSLPPFTLSLSRPPLYLTFTPFPRSQK